MTTTHHRTASRVAPAESGQPPVVGRGGHRHDDVAQPPRAHCGPPRRSSSRPLQPIMFTLLFTYVFGGAIHVPGGHYVDFLMPGIFVQTVIFGAMSTAVGLSEDLHKGLIERFRALPMGRSAVLAGRTTSDLVRNVFVVALITAVGFAVGFRIGTNVALFLCGVLLILLFAYALSWGFATIGLSAPNAETAQVMVFPILFPLLFASSAFVPVATMPGWLQAFAEHQPVTQVVERARAR